MSSRIAGIHESASALAARWPDLASMERKSAARQEAAAQHQEHEALQAAKGALEKAMAQCREHQLRIADLEREIEARSRSCYQEGHASGEAEARDRAEQEHRTIAERVSRSIADMATLRARIREEAEEDLVKLSLAIARRIIKRELTVDPEALRGVIRVALDKLQSNETAKVRVHPQQEAAVRACLERMGASSVVALRADNTLGWGDIHLDTPRGTLDASIETQLQEIEYGFSDRLAR